ncbi:hypothetical protein B6N60_04986 [Richelia sinica FACHB-800]|uniref:Uncharacterized protein n=1 Tax=Richelia sinica FACHB-800 TaxID=1357546 RepID=A0A975TD42_9NOST|nr:hypothetical protein B6N60_04986 [Richelia sinica FACHB-800]
MSGEKQLTDSKYQKQVFTDANKIISPTFPELNIDI